MDANWGGAMRRRLKLLNTQELAATLEVSEYAVRDWRKAGTGPRFARLGRRIYYTEDDVLAWHQARAVQQDSGPEED